MPKMKTHQGAQKRFRVSATGILKRSKAGKKHLNGPKTAKRKRHLRKPFNAKDKLAHTYKLLMGEA